jgi:preprotein translocase subunit SecF
MDLIGKRRLYFFISIVLVVISLGALLSNYFIRGQAMNFGIDFTGGTMLNLRFAQPVTVGEVRAVLDEFRYPDAVIQKSTEHDVSIRTEPLETEKRQAIIREMEKRFNGVELMEADTIGPVIGKELRTQAFWALIVASVLIILYVSFRFEFKYAVVALIALYHDAIITTGIMAILWRTIDTTFVAAILTIMGYSINDTIVIFDRIRENLKKHENSKKKYAEIINNSVWQTMARSINTTLTCLFVVLALLIFGGETLTNFLLTLLIGFFLGAYSSIFLASPLLVVARDWITAKKK